VPPPTEAAPYPTPAAAAADAWLLQRQRQPLLLLLPRHSAGCWKLSGLLAPHPLLLVLMPEWLCLHCCLARPHLLHLWLHRLLLLLLLLLLDHQHPTPLLEEAA
jgi:hypothetical protein